MIQVRTARWRCKHLSRSEIVYMLIEPDWQFFCVFSCILFAWLSSSRWPFALLLASLWRWWLWTTFRLILQSSMKAWWKLSPLLHSKAGTIKIVGQLRPDPNLLSKVETENDEEPLHFFLKVVANHEARPRSHSIHHPTCEKAGICLKVCVRVCADMCQEWFESSVARRIS